MTTKAERTEALTKLQEWIKPGAQVNTILRHVSRSGMQRSISLLISLDGEPYEISWLVARALGDNIDQNRGGIKVTGGGMDMGFHLVYNLGRVMFPDGFDTTMPGCRSRNGDTSGWDSDGGYALRQRWL